METLTNEGGAVVPEQNNIAPLTDDSQKMLDWLMAHPDEEITALALAEATGVEINKASQWLVNCVGRKRMGRSHMRYKPIAGKVFRLDGATFIYQPRRQIHEDAGSTPLMLERDHLFSVVKSFPNGRVILADEQGDIFTGTLRRIEEGS